MLKLNEENGLRDYEYTYDYEVNGVKASISSASANCTSDPYFGKKIAGGYYVSGEASYIKKIGKHWFLFLSYGGLTSDGGYQMRIFRADKAEGPYKDCYGTSALYKNYVLNFGAGAKDNRGVLLMGGYQWNTMPSAELAQGHNSAFTDKQGRNFVVYHTRFNDGTEGHQVRVHQLFLNDEGWLVAAPFEFDGETATDENIAAEASISNEDIPGDYQFIRHQYNQNTASKAYEKPINIKLTSNGAISGGVTGTWSRTVGTDYINLKIGGVVYRGVLIQQHVDYTNIPAIAIAALSSSSGSLTIGQNSFTYQQEVWAVKADAKGAIKYTFDHLNIPFSNGSTVNVRQVMPTTGFLGAKVAWTTSDDAIMTSGGFIKGKGVVTMTLKITKDDYVYTKEYNIHVDKDAVASSLFYPESQTKNTSAAWWTNFSCQNYTLKKDSEIEFKFYNYNNRSNNWCNWALYGASATHGSTNYTEYFGLRCDNWNNTANSNVGCTNDYNWNTFVQDMDGSLVDMKLTYDASAKLSMVATITTVGKKVYHYSYTSTLAGAPSTITLFFVNEGSYIDGSSLVATSIESPVVYNKVYNSDGKWYNLAGQQVAPSYKGIVVVNGKKMFNK